MVYRLERLLCDLQRLWEKAERDCRKEHDFQDGFWINYVEVELVFLCDHCYSKTAEKHNEIAKKYDC